MTVTLGRPLTTEPPTPSTPDALDALDVVRRARRAPVRHHRRLLAGLLVALVGAFAARVLLGDYTVTVPDLVRILGGEQIPGATYIVMESKLPRAVLAVLVGVAFGVGGAIFQTTLRNPLASPDIVGVSLGASAAAITVIALAGWTGWAVSAAAIVGALAVALAVRAVAGDHGGFRLVLAGIGLAAAMQSVIQYVFTRVDEYDVQLVLRWLTGSVNGVAWQAIGLLALALAVLLPATAWVARSLRATELGAPAGLEPDPARDLLGRPAVLEDLALDQRAQRRVVEQPLAAAAQPPLLVAPLGGRGAVERPVGPRPARVAPQLPRHGRLVAPDLAGDPADPGALPAKAHDVLALLDGKMRVPAHGGHLRCCLSQAPS